MTNVALMKLLIERYSLSVYQAEVACAVYEHGATYKQIAHARGISERAVMEHMKLIYLKMGIGGNLKKKIRLIRMLSELNTKSK